MRSVQRDQAGPDRYSTILVTWWRSSPATAARRELRYHDGARPAHGYAGAGRRVRGASV